MSNCANPSARLMSGIYGGGPIYKDSATSIAALKRSGFGEVIVWNIEVNPAGDLNFNYEFPLVSNGKYVGDLTHPDFAAHIASLKTAPTSVTRLTFSIGSSNVGVFQAIKALIEATGTGPQSILYQNFRALKTAFPTLDAIDFDDENCYDQPSMVRFAVMLGALGYDVALCPYTNQPFWIAVANAANAQRPGTVTAVHLQCYAGGGGNSPGADWNFGPVPVFPGLWDQSSSPAQVKARMSAWIADSGIEGGFIWFYDDIYKTAGLTEQYASAINLAGAAQPA
jgi:hypothetical protein